MHWLTKQLSNPKIYADTIEFYAVKQRMSNHLITQGLSEISIDNLLQEKDSLAKVLAELFNLNNLDFAALKRTVIEKNNKKRVVYNSETLENIMDATILRILLPKLQEYGIPGLYSFFKNTNPIKTMQKISQSLKQIYGDVYILRTDIVSYTDTIPTDEVSEIWHLLDNFIAWLDPLNVIDNYCYEIIKSRIKAPYKNKDGDIEHIKLGLPMGRALSTLVAALYLRDLDIMMSNIKNSLYVRFGDDIFWLSNNIENFNYGDNLLKQKLIDLRLSRSPTKEQYVTLTRSGAKYPATLDRFKGAMAIEYLGLSILRNGLIRLSLKNIQKLKTLINDRIKNANKLLKCKMNNEERIKTIVSMLNQLLKPDDSSMNRLNYLRMVTDRGQLKDLDFYIASRIIMICTHNYRLEVFKKHSYKWLRNQCGLVSLCTMRNSK